MENYQTKITSKEVLKKVKQFKDLDELPDDLRISTITITCRFDTNFFVDNIKKYIELNKYGVLYVGPRNGNPEDIRTIIPIKKKRKRRTKKKPIQNNSTLNVVKRRRRNVFFNQTTIVIYSKKYKKANLKLFKNGSIQMTGCKSIDHCFNALTILCNELKKTKAIVDLETMNSITIKPFVSNKDALCPSKIMDLKINMINSNFNIGFKIDRKELFQLLLDENIDCDYEPCIHACVNIKYNYRNLTNVSIFVFESGAIIITGAKHRDHIRCAYNFIVTKLFNNFHQIIKKDTERLLLKHPEILKCVSN